MIINSAIRRTPFSNTLTIVPIAPINVQLSSLHSSRIADSIADVLPSLHSSRIADSIADVLPTHPPPVSPSTITRI